MIDFPPKLPLRINQMADMKLKVQRTVFDLDAFEEVLLVKEVDFAPVSSTEEALARLGNDATKFLAILNEGLESEARRIGAENPNDWRTFGDDGEVNGLFEGTLADMKSVNNLVLTLAKTTFGYTKDASKDTKKAAKQSAMALIAATDVIKEGLRKSAAK